MNRVCNTPEMATINLTSVTAMYYYIHNQKWGRKVRAQERERDRARERGGRERERDRENVTCEKQYQKQQLYSLGLALEHF